MSLIESGHGLRNFPHARLLRDRIEFLGGVIDDDCAHLITAQLLFLESKDHHASRREQCPTTELPLLREGVVADVRIPEVARVGVPAPTRHRREELGRALVMRFGVLAISLTLYA